MFRQRPAECGPTPTRAPAAATGKAVSVIQGTNGRTALQLLSQGSSPGNTTLRHSTKESAVRPDPAPRRPAGSVWCPSGRVLVSQPAAGSPAGVSRRVFVRGNCHLYGASAAPPSSAADQCSDWRSKTMALLEVPRGWAPGEGLSEGEGRWVAGDGLVYAPLFCSCSGCGSTPVGEKAVGSGLFGQDLIGHAWFFPARVQTVDGDRVSVLDETNAVELFLPAHAATRENSQPPHR